MTSRVLLLLAALSLLSGCYQVGSLPGTQVEPITVEGRKFGNTLYHPVGTCKMGTDPRAAVDSRLRVHGIDGLRVIDASVMPTLTTGNPNAPTIMIGEKGAAMIQEDARA